MFLELTEEEVEGGKSGGWGEFGMNQLGRAVTIKSRCVQYMQWEVCKIGSM